MPGTGSDCARAHRRPAQSLQREAVTATDGPAARRWPAPAAARRASSPTASPTCSPCEGVRSARASSPSRSPTRRRRRCAAASRTSCCPPGSGRRSSRRSTRRACGSCASTRRASGLAAALRDLRRGRPPERGQGGACASCDLDERELTPAAVVHRISHAKNQMLDAGGGGAARPRRLARSASPRSTACTRRACSAVGAVDFDDLLLLVVRLFEHVARGASPGTARSGATSSSTSTRTPTARSTGSSGS